MESEVLFNIDKLSVEIAVIAILVFGFTMLLKWPIKRVTSKLEENKRKAVNTVIVFIPMFLSFVFSILYYGIFNNVWLSPLVFETMGSSYILAVGLYAIYSRIVIIIKGIKTDSTQMVDKQTVKCIKNLIKSLSTTIKTDQTFLDNIIIKIDELLLIREKLLSDTNYQDISGVEKLNQEIAKLQSQKENLQNSLSKMNDELQNYKKSI